jgi:hypothetical protein
MNLQPPLRRVITFLAFVLLIPVLAPAAEKLPPPVDQLPSIPQLPDPFLLSDGTRVKTPADWERRREQLMALILDYEYGHPPTEKVGVKGEQKSSIKTEFGALEREYLLTIGSNGKIATNLVLTLPAGKGPFPVIVKGDLCWKRVNPEIVAAVVKRGYALAEFDRTQIASDNKQRDNGVLAAYPNADEGDLVAWAWGFSRVIDFLVTLDEIDKGKVIATGHSRGGKAALLAGALDERIALTCPNGSGAGGAGCFRVSPPKTESLERIVTSFPNWFGPHFKQFIGHVDQLPFDQHCVRALVAPRALLNTDASGDVWANGPGTQQTYLAAKEVYQFLGVPEKIGVHWRDGGHQHNLIDFTALLDFADHVLLGKPAAQDFNKLPFPDEPKAFSWSAPARN